MNKVILRQMAVRMASLATALLGPGAAYAHCDGVDGPVVKAAQQAMAEGNVNRVLIWVQPGDDEAVTAAFRKTLTVRKLGPDARDLADRYFFETVVRIHRTGEGAPYTGLKPAGRDLGPVIPAADRAIEEQSDEGLLRLLPAPTHAEVRRLFQEVVAKRRFKADDVAAGRQYVAAYVTFMHAVERFHGGEKCPAGEVGHACGHTKHATQPAQETHVNIQINGKTTVRELVGRYPQTRKVFEEHGLDYCCGGGQSLADAAAKQGLETSALVTALEKAIRTPLASQSQVEKDWYAAPLPELVNHIVEVHHAYMKKALPRLRLLVPKVLHAHEANHGDLLRQVDTLFTALDAELSGHLLKEEQVLFPHLVAASGGGTKRPVAFGSVRNPIRQMELEHDSAGATLAKLREVTHNYALPDDACPTFKAVYDELQQMEADLHQHIHLENNILFPRAVGLEAEVR